VQLDNIKKIKDSFIERIDNTHANARKTWTDMGAPGNLTAKELSALELASALIMEPFATRQEEGSAFVEITVPPQGIVYITLELELKSQ